MLRSLFRLWVGEPEIRTVLVDLPVELCNSLDAIAFAVNDRKRALGSAQGGSEFWHYVTREDLIQEAVHNFVRKHIQTSEPRAAAIARRPDPDPGPSRIQRRN